MRRLFKTFLALSLVFFAFSCQNEVDNGTLREGAFKVTAKMAAQATRVSYDVTTDLIQPGWEVNDEIFGWDDAGNTFTFTVASVDETTGDAQIDAGGYAPASATKLYAVYYPGKTVADIADGKIAVDLSIQNGSLNTYSPVVMCATAVVSGNEAVLSFENQTAIVAVNKMLLLPGETLRNVTIEGVVTAGEIAVVDDKLTITPSAEKSAITAAISLSADSDGYITSPVYFAALPGGEAEISLSAEGDITTYTAVVGTKEVAAGQFYHMAKKMAAQAPFEVDGVPCISAAEALAAVNGASASEVTVTLLDDVTLDIPFAVTNTTSSVLFDLAGKTLTVNSYENCISVASGADFTLTDSSEGGMIKVTATGDNSTDLKATGIKGSGNITVTGGTISTKTSSWYPAGVAVDGGGSLTISGGTITGGRCVVVSGEGTTASITGGTVACVYNGSNTGISSAGFYILGGASITVDNVEATASFTGTAEGVDPIVFYITGEGSEATVNGGTFEGQHYSFLTNTNAKLTINDCVSTADYGVFAQKASTIVMNGGELQGASAGAYITGSSFVLNNGTVSGDSSYGVRSLGGATCTLNGGLVISKQSHAIAPTGSTASFINVHGGTYVTETDVKYPIYVATEATAHKITVDNEVSEPYFFGGATETDRVAWRGYLVNVVEIRAGYFEKQWLGKESDQYLMPGFMKVTCDETVDGRHYNYQVVPDPSAVYVAQFDGTSYFTFSEAVDAAKEYDGSSDEATVTLIANAELKAATDFTNANGKPMVIDLNGYTLTATVDSCLTTTGVLTITDKTGTTGTYSSSKLKMIELIDKGTINVEKCTLLNDRLGYAATGTHYSIIGIDGTSSSSTAVLNFNNVKMRVASRIKIAYVKYGTWNITDSELSNGVNADGSGYNGIYTNSGAHVNLLRSSIYTPGTGNAYPFNVQGKSANASVVIEESYLYGAKAVNAGSGYDAALTVKSGWFNTDISGLTNATFVGTFGACEPAATYTHNGETLEYGFKCE